LAKFGRRRLTADVAYLETVRGRRLPGVHPVQPIVSGRRLLLFMFPSSPKANDLQRDGRYALHTAVADTEGSNGEFLVVCVRGRARRVTDPAVRAEAAAAGYRPRDEYILFEFGVDEALVNDYRDGRPNYRQWSAHEGRHTAPHPGKGSGSGVGSANPSGS